MKKKLLAIIKPLIYASLALSVWLEYYFPSILFFGEYPYPIDTSK